MLSVRIIPCLDVRHGRVVKGVQFQGLRDAGDPAELAARYEQEGADEIVVLDVAATPEGREHGLATVRSVRAVLSIPLTVGGGVRSIGDAEQLLEAGADKVAINTAAVRDPILISQLSQRFGRQCIVVAIDAKRNRADSWHVVVRSGSEAAGIDVCTWASEAEQRGAGELLLTSWDRDGTQAGYDTALLVAVRARVGIPIVASGGAAGPEHLHAALQAGADAVLAASIFHDRHTTPQKLKRYLAAQGIHVRP